MKIRNTTLQNKTKLDRLNSEHQIPTHHVDSPEVSRFLSRLDYSEFSKEDILFTLGDLLTAHIENPYLKELKSSLVYVTVPIVEQIPHEAFDLLGSTYQFLNSKSENLAAGSFYTSKSISIDMVQDLDFTSGQTIFDPSCGSGVFLFRSGAGSSQIFGVDFDPLAVVIAKFNYFLKFPDGGRPNIFHGDFFEWSLRNPDLQFDYVVGNPPYGANIDIAKIPSYYVKSGESFSYFIEIGFEHVKPDGRLKYLVPLSLLNVKRHSDIREFILDRTGLCRVKRYSSKFAGVMTDVYTIELERKNRETCIFEDQGETTVPLKVFDQLDNRIIVPLNELDISILGKVSALDCLDLRQSIFGLGVVTGDNQSKLVGTPGVGLEPIYTGKEVDKFTLLPPKNFLRFDRNSLQQVAPDVIYRTKPKLIYKTIGTRLKFAIDTAGSLSTNSANILIPNVAGYDVRMVAAFLNSSFYSYLHHNLSGGVNKVGKENLQRLPFPKLGDAHAQELKILLDKFERGQSFAAIELFISKEIFGLSDNEVDYVMRLMAPAREDRE